MTKPSILYYEALNYNGKNLDELLDKFTVYMIPDPRYDTQLTDESVEEIEAIFLPQGFKFGVQQLNKFSSLKVIASNTTTRPEISPGLDADIQVVWLNDTRFLESITSTAEHALGLMHAVHRDILRATDDTYISKWNRYDHGAPKMLSNMMATVWGHGRVGKHLIKRCQQLFGHVVYIEKANSDHYIMNVLQHTDVLFLTMSVVGQQPVVTKSHLERLPTSAIVINVARGECLDNQTLFGMLLEGELRGAGLDVLPADHTYPYGETSDEWEWARDYMKDHSNLIITPHIAGSTEDAWDKTQKYVIDRVKEILL